MAITHACKEAAEREQQQSDGKAHHSNGTTALHGCIGQRAVRLFSCRTRTFKSFCRMLEPDADEYESYRAVGPIRDICKW